MIISLEPIHLRHDLHHESPSRKVPVTTSEPLPGLCRPHQGLWHGQQRTSMGRAQQVQFPSPVSDLLQFHNGMMTRVIGGSLVSDAFKVFIGMKQGCVLAPVVFNLFLVAVTLVFLTTSLQMMVSPSTIFSTEIFQSQTTLGEDQSPKISSQICSMQMLLLYPATPSIAFKKT